MSGEIALKAKQDFVKMGGSADWREQNALGRQMMRRMIWRRWRVVWQIAFIDPQFVFDDRKSEWGAPYGHPSCRLLDCGSMQILSERNRAVSLSVVSQRSFAIRHQWIDGRKRDFRKLRAESPLVSERADVGNSSLAALDTTRSNSEQVTLLGTRPAADERASRMGTRGVRETTAGLNFGEKG